MEWNGDDEIGEWEGVMRYRFCEKERERIGGRLDKAILQREDKFLDEAGVIRSGNKKSVQRGVFPTVTTNSAILLVRPPADGALLEFDFWNSSSARRAGERALLVAAKTTEREEEIDEYLSERGQCRAGSRAPAASGRASQASCRRGQIRHILGHSS